MFMEIAIGAIGIGIVLMVGYIVVSQVKSALPSATSVYVSNPCLGQVGAVATGSCVNASGVYTSPTVCGATNLAGYNTTSIVPCENVGYTSGTNSVTVTIFAGFGLVAVGIIVLAAFGLINVFK